MAHERLVSVLLGRHREPLPTLEDYFASEGQAAWNRLSNVVRSSPGLVDDDVIDWAWKRAAESPGSLCVVLIEIAAREKERREKAAGLARRLVAEHPREALRAAGYFLHEHHVLLDAAWIELALKHHDADPEGAWGILESASMYERELIAPSHVEWMEEHRATMPRDYFVCLFNLAMHWPERRDDLLSRVLRSFPAHPAQAVDAAAFAARDDKELLTPELVAAVLRHFDAASERAWEYFDSACKTAAERFDDALLDALTARTDKVPGTLLSIFRRLIDGDAARAASLMRRYVALVRKHPEEGIKNVRYDFQNEDIRLVRRDLVEAVCAGFAANAYPAYEFLNRCIEDRPELIGAPEVEAAVRNIGHATNYAFGFFRELLKKRPEFTRECAHALFECLAQEPAHRAHVRAEEMESLTAISEAAHVKTGLEKALAEPPRSGSRRARGLMAVMFRQKLRARRHVLLEALRHAATIVLWREVPGRESERYSPIWDFVMFIIDHADEDAVSTAAAERFLEGAFQLSFLCRTGAEHTAFLASLDLGNAPAVPFPAGVDFLGADPGIARLHDQVVELGRRFSFPVRMAPIDDFVGRLKAAESELAAVTRQVASVAEAKRPRLEERARNLEKRIACWRGPDYARAFGDPAAETRLPDEARSLLRREKKDLAKHVRDALRAEAIRIAVAAVDRSRQELYRNRLKDVLGRDVDIERIEPKILPSFLWFQALGGMEKNTAGLRRLIEDRMEGRPHDWLRTEAAALAWAKRVGKGTPGVRLENWRAPFTKDYPYRPGDALAEKRRRIKADLAQARTLLEKAGAKGIAETTYEALAAALQMLKEPPPRDDPKKESTRRTRRLPPDPALLEEVAMNLARVRIAEQTPDSDFEGKVTLSVETDPFEMLFMGEYGFASCLSLRGSNAWSAVSNAIDIDKAILWAREPGGNVVGRRLLALTPKGILAYRTYTNRHGLPLDRIFDEFIGAYAAHCGTTITHEGKVGPLLSDRWYDDGAL